MSRQRTDNKFSKNLYDSGFGFTLSITIWQRQTINDNNSWFKGYHSVRNNKQTTHKYLARTDNQFSKNFYMIQVLVLFCQFVKAFYNSGTQRHG